MKAARPERTSPEAKSRKPLKPKLLSGGNPQIAKGDGDAPVQACIADIREGELDEGQFTDWVKQASQLPGEQL
jgi:hypothetical protein